MKELYKMNPKRLFKDPTFLAMTPGQRSDVRYAGMEYWSKRGEVWIKVAIAGAILAGVSRIILLFL